MKPYLRIVRSRVKNKTTKKSLTAFPLLLRILTCNVSYRFFLFIKLNQCIIFVIIKKML